MQVIKSWPSVNQTWQWNILHSLRWFSQRTKNLRLVRGFPIGLPVLGDKPDNPPWNPCKKSLLLMVTSHHSMIFLIFRWLFPIKNPSKKILLVDGYPFKKILIDGTNPFWFFRVTYSNGWRSKSTPKFRQPWCSSLAWSSFSCRWPDPSSWRLEIAKGGEKYGNF